MNQRLWGGLGLCAIAIAAAVFASIMLLTAATLVAKNLLRAGRSPASGGTGTSGSARWVVLALSGVGVGLALHSTPTIAALLLLAYSGVAQFFPGFVFGLLWPRATRQGVTAGLIVGLVVAGMLTWNGLDPIGGFNAGFVGLAANFAVAVVGSLFTKPQPDGLQQAATAPAG